MRPRSLSDGPPQASATEIMRARIRVLMRDPAVAQRVGRKLARAAEVPVGDMAGTPPGFRAGGTGPGAPVLVRRGHSRETCRSIDCLCGSYPRSRNDREIAHGRRLEPLAP